MSIHSELCMAWFAETYLNQRGSGLKVLDAGVNANLAILKNIFEKHHITDARLNNSHLSNSQTPHSEEHLYNTAIVSISGNDKKTLEQTLNEVARAVKPEGLICLALSCDKLQDGSLEAALLTEAALNAKLLPLHVSVNLAPLCASPAWYDKERTNALLVLSKSAHWPEGLEEFKSSDAQKQLKALSGNFVPEALQPWIKDAPLPEKTIPKGPAGRINYLIQRYDAQSYLEISAQKGKVFSLVSAPVKVLANPTAEASEKKVNATATVAVPLKSDQFFKELADSTSWVRALVTKLTPSLLFDVIFINGLHNFKQSLSDFASSLAHAHKNTIFVLNSTVPCDPYSALKSQNKANAYRQYLGLKGNEWHGDVFKTVLAIHDFFPQYSYCTVLEKTAQTFVWQAEEQKRTPLFTSLESIDALDYFGLLEHSAAMMPVDGEMLPRLIGKALEPCKYYGPAAWKKLLYSLPEAEGK